MILKTYPNKNLYGKYFLATEAPDDEEITEDQPKPRRNVKVVTVKPSNRGKDFTQVGNTEVPEETDVPDGTDTAEEQPTPDTDTEQPTEDGQTGTDTEPTDQPDTGETDDTDFTNDAESEQTDDTQTDGDETGEDGPDTGGDEDFAATDDQTQSNDAGTTADQSTDGGDANTQQAGKPNAPGVELDSTRKYNLYKEFMSLYNACDNYIGKLENILKDDSDENKIIRISVNNLRDIKDIIYDYMTIRFQLNTYVQSLLFYQKMVVAVQLVFNLLKSIKSNNKTK